METIIRIGILGAFRGYDLYKSVKECEVVAICDNNEEVLEHVKSLIKSNKIAYYTNFDEFIKHKMDGVVLANYATEHAPFAIKAMKEGKHVLSEVLPCQTMKEAVELIECIEESKMIYCYAENYCYFASTRKMKELYQNGLIGDFEYGEGEYIHNCEPIWPNITYGDENHWRNNQYANYYCTHSIGPLIHITKLKPVSVVGFELPYSDRKARMGAKGGTAGIEMITLENGSIIKSIHGDLVKNSIWYTIYGSKGQLECAREDECEDNISILYQNIDSKEAVFDGRSKRFVLDKVSSFGHGGSDYYPINNFIKKLKGEEADTIDIYEALDMFLPGMFAYRSVLKGNISLEIPNLRIKEQRDKYRNDTMCTDKKVAKDMYITPYSKCEINPPKEVYQEIKAKYEKMKNDK